MKSKEKLIAAQPEFPKCVFPPCKRKNILKHPSRLCDQHRDIAEFVSWFGRQVQIAQQQAQLKSKLVSPGGQKLL